MTRGAHFWRGKWITENAAERRLRSLAGEASDVLGEPFPVSLVVDACAHLSADLANSSGPVRKRLSPYLGTMTTEAAGEALAELSRELTREALYEKLERELGGPASGRFVRVSARANPFESWEPVGLLVHILPNNAPAIGVLSVVEGLLTGNFNVAKAGSRDTAFTFAVLAELAAKDPTGRLAQRIVGLRFPADRSDWLELLCADADAVAVWGGDRALAGIRGFVTPGCRLIDWGAKISVGYATESHLHDEETLDAFARMACAPVRHACSSPQVIYAGTTDHRELMAFGERFTKVLQTVPPAASEDWLSLQEQAEISNTILVADHEELLSLTQVQGEAGDRRRVIVDIRPDLRASPLHRIVWVKPLPRDQITATLRPYRRYLQTAGLAATRSEAPALVRRLISAGVDRITRPGEMLSGYPGEPRDGVYALQRYSRRVGVRHGGPFGEGRDLPDVGNRGRLAGDL
ncbi:aldehyde dehydrogenase family protein [Amycolatopsis sp. SID8362]|uniref:acyl-CoA reductase n=1 Tax=Amycolatopsis sp. SID8362 TaxID=2690346 RepID=UPI0013704D4F|nr:aldehyde dehydrogenase family protein [Amycolatopsis sp. SID8362]NBH06084.1 hypothetical protein [Amycolatopsis sp. SID8362]NED42783.1 hypothetical protein [Amycolatopsis sp. SID8362]